MRSIVVRTVRRKFRWSDRATLRSVLLAAVFFLLPPPPAVAQTGEMRFDHLSLEHGLSDLTVFCFAQDSSGFLWFGTGDGLNKYDGHTFSVFKNDPLDSTSLSPGQINTLCTDRRGVLWIGTPDGISLFHPDSNRPRHIHRSLSLDNPNSRFVNWLQALRDGDVAVGTAGGLYIYGHQTERFERMTFDTLEPLMITSLTEARDGTLWLATLHKGLIAFNRKTGAWRHYPPDDRKPAMLHGTTVNRVVQTHDGSIWVATDRCISRLDTATQLFAHYTDNKGLGQDIFFDVYVDRRGTLWVGAFHLGLGRYLPEADRFIRYMPDEEDPHSINSERIDCIFEDRGGVLWVATYRAGLNRHNVKGDAFKRFVPRRKPGEGLCGGGVYAILEDRYGEVWIGSYGAGLNRYNPRTGKYSYYKPVPRTRGSISGDDIVSLLESRNGDLWVGSYGLDRFDRTTGRFVHYPMVNEAKRQGSEREVKCLYEDRDGVIWFGTFTGGLHCLNPKTGEMKQYAHLGTDSLSPGIWGICEDTRGRLWLASYGNGLFMFDRKTERFHWFNYNPNTPSRSVSAAGLYDILCDDEGMLWIGTMGGGLDRLNPETMEFTRYTDKQGLPNNFVKGIEKDARGFLWLSTDFGLSRFDPKAGTFKNFKADDGLMGNVFLSGAHFVSNTGRMYFGGELGAVSFHPDSIMENNFIPPVVITTFRVLDRPYPLHLPRTFSHDQNSVAFEFVALDYTAPERNLYAYKIDGVDDHWIQAGNRRYANYPHLQPGTYTFRVIGSNNDRRWNEQGASLTFTISPPFWETWWFISAAILALVGAGVGAYNYRVNRLLEIERLRVRIASDLHDDIGSSLTKISLQSELIQEGFDPEEQQNYLKSIATMSRELVTSMSDIVWSIDARNDTVENLFDKMRSFGFSTLSAKEIGFSFAYSDFDLKKKLPVDVRENIYLIFKEAINNIAKHANAASVNVVLRNDSDKFSMVITDDGKGWDGMERPSGHGTKNMKMRAERLSGSIEFVKDEGTRVAFSMKRL
jgi:ligand-binding sensor domain-containing protein/two-component sensor histidine kinase